MKKLFPFAMLLAVAAIPALAAPAKPAAAEKAGDCDQIHAVIIDAQVTDGCTSPNKFCAAGVVIGDHGLIGKTYFITDSAIVGPPTRPGSIAASGILVYTTSRGTLTARESGLSLGAYFSNFDEILSGTGDFAGATGHFWLAGQQVQNHFETNVTGVLCRP
jgi:hypothetical protein